MRETYTGENFSLNKLRGNFYWVDQTDGSTFDGTRPFYVLFCSPYAKEISLYYISSRREDDLRLLLRLPSDRLKSYETLFFRTQQDIAEFLRLNQFLID